MPVEREREILTQDALVCEARYLNRERGEVLSGQWGPRREAGPREHCS